MKTFTYYCDPSHGWLKVSGLDAHDVGLDARDFSRFSYWRNNDLYLEEDCDAPKFLKAYEGKHGHAPRIRESHTASPSRIRSYMRLPG